MCPLPVANVPRVRELEEAGCVSERPRHRKRSSRRSYDVQPARKLALRMRLPAHARVRHRCRAQQLIAPCSIALRPPAHTPRRCLAIASPTTRECWTGRSRSHSLSTADAFADAAETDDSGKDYVHIRIQQRNGKKSLTTIQVCSAFIYVRLCAYLSPAIKACACPMSGACCRVRYGSIMDSLSAA